MFTRCPVCHTLFRLQSDNLKAARGQVRCGSCHTVFDAVASLVNQDELTKQELAALAPPPKRIDTRQQPLPFDQEVPAAPEPSPTAEPIAETAVAEPLMAPPPPHVSDAITVIETPAATPADAAPSPARSEADEKRAPLELEPQPRRYSLDAGEMEHQPPARGSRLGWGLGSLLLITVLAGQLIFLQREQLALDARWRPWLERFCAEAGCSLPPLRDLAAIVMVDRNVQSHADYRDALAITATLVNQAPFAQPYPEVELAMTDLEQRRIAVRRFRPAEYLEQGNGTGLIPAGASFHLKLEIADPGQEAVGFEFAFY